MEFGKKGSGPGEFDGPHALAFDSHGRLLVGDRTNNRIQIFNQKGKFIHELKQYGRPSGIFIAAGDILYVTDSESQSERAGQYGYDPGVQRGIRVGALKDGKITALSPDSAPKGGTSISEGVAVDHDGNELWRGSGAARFEEVRQKLKEQGTDGSIQHS